MTKKHYRNKNHNNTVKNKRNYSIISGGMKRSGKDLMFPNKKINVKQQSKNKETLEKLLLEKNNYDEQRLNTINELINSGNYNINFIYTASNGVKQEQFGNNLLQQAIMNEYYEQALLLINHNADNNIFLNNSNQRGATPLMLLALVGKIEVLNRLLEIHSSGITEIEVGSNKLISNNEPITDISNQQIDDPFAMTNFTTLMYVLYIIRMTIGMYNEDNDYFNYDELRDLIEPFCSIFNRLMETFGNKLEPQYANNNGVTALIIITSVDDYTHDTRKIVNSLLDTNNYNPSSFVRIVLSNAFINCISAQNSNADFLLVQKMLQKRSIEGLDFDINHRTIDGETALYAVSSYVLDRTYDPLRLTSLLLEQPNIDINIYETLKNNPNIITNSYLLKFINETAGRTVFYLFSSNGGEEQIREFERFVEITEEILRRDTNHSLVKFIRQPFQDELGVYLRKTNALTAYIQHIKRTRETWSNGATYDNIPKNLLERIPLAILNSTQFTREYLTLDVTGNNTTVLDIAIQLGLTNVSQKIEEMLNQIEIEEQQNLPRINLFNSGMNILGEEIMIYKYINADINNFVFKISDNIYLLNKKSIREHVDNPRHNVYSCSSRGPFNQQNPFNIRIINRNIVYNLINKYTGIQGVIKQNDILELINSKYSGQFFTLLEDGNIVSNINKSMLDYQIGVETNWNEYFSEERICMGGSLVVYKIVPSMPSVGNNILNDIEKQDNLNMETSKLSMNDTKVKARITYKNQNNKLEEKGIREFDTSKGMTIKDLKDKIIKMIYDETNINEPINIDNLIISRLIFSGKDYTNKEDVEISTIITPEINTFQPVIVTVKKEQQIGGKKYKKKNFSRKKM